MSSPAQTNAVRDAATHNPRDASCDAPGQAGRGPVLAWSILAALGMIGSALILRTTDISGVARFAVAMAPVPLLACMYWAMFRVVQRIDEMQRKMKLEALGLTVILASLILFTTGQLERVGIYEHTDPSVAWLVVTFTFIAATGLVHLRYRVWPC